MMPQHDAARSLVGLQYIVFPSVRGGYPSKETESRKLGGPVRSSYSLEEHEAYCDVHFRTANGRAAVWNRHKLGSQSQRFCTLAVAGLATCGPPAEQVGAFSTIGPGTKSKAKLSMTPTYREKVLTAPH